MKRNEYAVKCIARDGAVSVWLYDITPGTDAGQRVCNVRAWPQDAPSPDNGGEWYDITLQEVDSESVRVTMANNHLPEGHRGRGVAVALYPILARRFGCRLLSSRTVVPGTNEWRTDRATEIWRYLVTRGDAEELPGEDVFLIDGRPGHAKPTEAGPLPEWAVPTTDVEFESFMREIDRRLQSESVPIVGRVIRGIGEASKMLAAGLPVSVPKRDPVAGAYEGDDLVMRMSQWFDAQYGERLLMNTSRGRVAVLVRNDVWILKIPWLIGQVRLLASRTIPSDNPEPRAFRADDPKHIGAPPPLYNILDSVTGLPAGLRQDLSEEELSALLFTFETGINAYGALRSIQEIQYIREGIADHLATADHLAGGQLGHLGPARWSALQAVEKVYKALLAACGGPIPHTHDLAKLSERAEQFGMHGADPDLINAVQCTAAVRYGELPVTLAEAVAAHHAALDLSWYIAEEINVRQAGTSDHH